MKNNPQPDHTRQKKYDILINSISPLGIVIISFLSGIFIWVIDAVLDYLVFYQEAESFANILILNIPSHELYIRIVILGVFLFFGIVISMHFSSRLKSEEDLMRSEKNLNTTLNSIGDAVIATDVNGNITKMNPVAEELTGWQESEAFGKHLKEIFKIINVITNESVEDPASKVLTNGKIVQLANHTLLVTRSGLKIPIADSGAPIIDESGKITGVVLVFRDQTKERLNHKLLETRLRFAEYANNHSLKELTTYVLKEICSELESPDGYYHFIDTDKSKKSNFSIWRGHEVDDLTTGDNEYLYKNIEEIGAWRECSEHYKPVIKEIDVKDLEIKRVLTVPVVRNNKMVALLSIINKGSAYTNQDEEIALYLADITWDIIRHKRMEEDLRESEMKYRNVFESANDAILILKGEKIIACNNAAINMFGCNSKADIIEHTPLDFSPKIQPDGNNSEGKAKNVIKAAYKGKEQLFYWQHIKPNREYFDAQVSLNRFNLDDNLHLQAIVRDISANKKAEEDLRKSEERYRQLAETMPDLILLLDLHGHIKYVNSAWYGATGHSCDSVIGKLITDYIPIESDVTGADVDPQVQFKKSFRYKTKIIDKNNSAVPVEINSTPLFIGDTVNEILIVIHNISEQIKHENELILAREKAEESDRLKSAFLANMSHEIRTPMNGILGFSDLLKQPRLTLEERLQYIEVIEKSGKRMLSIINDLIDISKIEAGQVEVIVSEINLNDQFDYLYAFFKPQAEKSGLELLYKKGLSNDDSFIYSDKDKLIAVLINIIRNAIKYTNTGYIEFGYVKKEDRIEFYVKDTGIGIAKVRQKAIFERFVQADLSISHPYEGAGLGLAISKGYIELLNGTIWLESEKNKGSSFFVSIPVKINKKLSK